jgi:RNA polymerase sigma-70 factor (ECF subfamily)
MPTREPGEGDVGWHRARVAETPAARPDMCRVNARSGERMGVTAARRRRELFDALFREHVAGIGSYCRWRSLSFADAEDAVAEVFMIAWRRLDDVPTGTDARLWLYGTARRVLANQARGNVRRGKLTEKLSAQPARLETDDDPLAVRVHEALAALDAGDREILLLAEWEGLTAAEIATVLHRPPVTVRVRLHRVRGRFRAAFETTASETAEVLRAPVGRRLSRCRP